MKTNGLHPIPIKHFTPLRTNTHQGTLDRSAAVFGSLRRRWWRRCCWVIFVVLSLVNTGTTQHDTLVLTKQQYVRSTSPNFILASPTVFPATSGFRHLKLDSIYQLSFPVSGYTVGERLTLLSPTGVEIPFYVTALPILKLYPVDSIVDEPRRAAKFSLRSPAHGTVNGWLGVEYRGGWTQTLSKKSMRLELWQDSTGVDTRKINLLGMREDDDWNLQAMFNEPLRVRSRLGFELWEELRALPYTDDEPKAIPGLRQHYVEVLINDEYRGIYALSERIDRKQLQLRRPDESGWRGELYKATTWGPVTSFQSVPNPQSGAEVWGGMERIFPDGETDWVRLSQFLDLVVHAPEADFRERIGAWLEEDNAVDYFLFINLIRAMDNVIKNNYLARYDRNQPYFYVPWDLDGTWGNAWNGERDMTTQGVVEQALFERLLADCSQSGFTRRMQERWRELRNALFTEEQLSERLTTLVDVLQTNRAYEREALTWTLPDFALAYEIDYFHLWTQERLDWLDEHLLALCPTSSTHPVPTNPSVTLLAHPVRDLLQLQIADPSLIHTLRLYDIAGCWWSDIKPAKEVHWPVAHLPRGLYVLQIVTTGRVQSLRWVKG